MDNAMQSAEMPQSFVNDHPHLGGIGHIGLQQQEFGPCCFHLLQATNRAAGGIALIMLCPPAFPLLSSRESRAAHQHEPRLYTASQVLGQDRTHATEGARNKIDTPCP